MTDEKVKKLVRVSQRINSIINEEGLNTEDACIIAGQIFTCAITSAGSPQERVFLRRGLIKSVRKAIPLPVE